jgi:hypothetical protein
VGWERGFVPDVRRRAPFSPRLGPGTHVVGGVEDEGAQEEVLGMRGRGERPRGELVVYC